MYKEVMIDLESLSLSQRSVLVAIGVVAFNLEDEDNYDSLDVGDRWFYETPEIDLQLGVGRKISDSTLRWWMEQPIIAQTSTFSTGKNVSAPEVLQALEVFVTKQSGGSSRDMYLWANHTFFDIGNLWSLYEDFELKCPFSHSKVMDFPMMDRLAGYPDLHIPSGVQHNALDDAKYQVLKTQALYRMLKNGPKA